MVKIIFVCYYQGTGGEHLSVEVSKLDQCYDLEYHRVGNRYVTNDITKGLLRHEAKRDNPILFKQKLSQIKSFFARKQHIFPHNKWYVVPAHFTPKELEDLDIDKKFISITTPNDNSHIEKIVEKVLPHRFTNILELTGQIKSDGYDPKFILHNQKGALSYVELQCLYKGWPITDLNLQKITEEFIELSKDPLFKQTFINALNVPYNDTLLPNFYSNFTKKIHQLTK